MVDCHKACMTLMEKELDNIRGLRKNYALDCGCGDGRVSRELLVKKFQRVDLFDPCPVGVQKVLELKKKKKQIGDVSVSTMQNYPWPRNYDGIFLVWVAGYLSYMDLVAFLKTAKQHLAGQNRSPSKRATPGAFIFVLDSVLAPLELPVTLKGQRVRSEEKFEDIFKKAGLTIY